jgi:DNA-binding XRE family transcriptional regulator
MKVKLVKEAALAALAKKCRQKSGKNRAEAARELKVNRATIQFAEEKPEQSLTKLRIRMIQKFSSAKVTGPLYAIKGACL